MKRKAEPVRFRKLTIPFLLVAALIMTSCGPSAEEQAARDRRQAEVAARQEAERDAAEAETKAAEASFRSWLDRSMADPTVKPRRYYSALREVRVAGSRLSLSLDLADRDEAVKLCNITLVGWTERARFGITKVDVVTAGSQARLAESAKNNAGYVVCRPAN